MRFIANLTKRALLSVFFLAWRVKSLNFTVLVTLTPQYCLLPLQLLNLLQPNLAPWILEALPASLSFSIPDEFVLVYGNPSLRHQRMLRGSDNDNNNNKEQTSSRSLTTKATTTAVKPTTCTSGGCVQYAAAGGCSFCSSSRRSLAVEETSTTPSPLESEDSVAERETLNLDVVDFVALGTQVSAAVQEELQTFLLSQVVGILGCLGDPMFLNLQVTFLLNQTFSP
jgi:hypothetical protein